MPIRIWARTGKSRRLTGLWSTWLSVPASACSLQHSLLYVSCGLAVTEATMRRAKPIILLSCCPWLSCGAAPLPGRDAANRGSIAIATRYSLLARKDGVVSIESYRSRGTIHSQTSTRCSALPGECQGAFGASSNCGDVSTWTSISACRLPESGLTQYV